MFSQGVKVYKTTVKKSGQLREKLLIQRKSTVGKPIEISVTEIERHRNDK